MQSAKMLGDLLDSAIGAKTHYDMWWTQASVSRRDLIKAMNMHSDFFRASRDAHYVAFFTYFAQLFDKRKDVSSIRNYLKLVKLSMNSILLCEVTNRHNALLPRAEPLIQVRHRRIAHIDAKLSDKDVFSPLNLTWNDIRDTIYDASELVAKIAGAENPGTVGVPRDGRISEATLGLVRALCGGNA